MKKATVLLGGVVAGAARSKHTNLANTNENNNHHPESDAISSRPRISNSTLRLLQQKDNNAMMRVPPNKPPVGKSGNANMPPYEKHHGTTRPLMPTLSAAAAAAKNTNKTPLTPRVAGSTPQSATTPLSRRGPRPDASQRDEVTTPISSFLSNNITPRSGSRRSRVDSTNTTPTGTPTGTPVPLLAHETPRAGGQEGQMYGLGTNGADRDIPKRQNVSFTQDVGTARPSADASSSLPVMQRLFNRLPGRLSSPRHHHRPFYMPMESRYRRRPNGRVTPVWAHRWERTLLLLNFFMPMARRIFNQLPAHISPHRGPAR
jgi:hypothetical protein